MREHAIFDCPDLTCDFCRDKFYNLSSLTSIFLKEFRFSKQTEEAAHVCREKIKNELLEKAGDIS